LFPARVEALAKKLADKHGVDKSVILPILYDEIIKHESQHIVQHVEGRIPDKRTTRAHPIELEAYEKGSIKAAINRIIAAPPAPVAPTVEISPTAPAWFKAAPTRETREVPVAEKTPERVEVGEAPVEPPQPERSSVRLPEPQIEEKKTGPILDDTAGAILSYMEDSAKIARDEPLSGKRVLRPEYFEEVAGAEGPKYTGSESLVPEWMRKQDTKAKDAYDFREVVEVIDALKNNKWPALTADDARAVKVGKKSPQAILKRKRKIAEALIEAIRGDAESEKANAENDMREALAPSETSRQARERKAWETFNAAVIQGSEEEAAAQATAPTPAPAARPQANQPEMFTGRQMIGPAVTPGKIRTTVPQAATGDELLRGFQKPEPERQGELPTSPLPPQVQRAIKAKKRTGVGP
jgi:hypothetical protein